MERNTLSCDLKQMKMFSFASPQAVFLQSVANLTLGLLSNPYILQLCCRGLSSLSRWQDTTKIVCVFLIPFKLSKISCCALQQPQMLLLCPKQLARCGDMTPVSIYLILLGAGPVLLTLPPLFLFLLFCPSELCGELYIPFLMVRYFCQLSGGVQDVLYLKMYSDTSVERDTYVHLPSAILFLLQLIFLFSNSVKNGGEGKALSKLQAP